MLKLFLPASTRATEAEFWEKSWGSDDAEVAPLPDARENDRICEAQPLWPVFEQYRRPDRLFFEGGCGPAHWVRYYARRGQRILGLDFAARTLERVRAVEPQTPVISGDIHAIPLGDGDAQLYYSGGVVEHIESGPLPALREARRVIAPDGHFLCSVPDDSPLRHVLYPNRDGRLRSSMLTQCAYKASDETTVEEHRDLGFYQYCFSQAEFRALLEQAGFVVEATIGMFFIHGLLEAELLSKPFHRAMGGGVVPAREGAPPSARVGPSDTSSELAVGGTAPSWKSQLKQRIKDVVLGERATNALESALVGTLRWSAPNMRLYIARPA